MYRVLAARSLKFLEQREEDTVSYQRQFKEARAGKAASAGSQKKRAHGRKHAEAGGGRRSNEEKENGDDGASDFRSQHHQHHPQSGSGSGGHFNATYPDRSATTTTNAGSYSKQVGEKSASVPPLLGYPPREGSSSGPGGLSSSSPPAAAASSSSSSATALPSTIRPHATIIVHEKTDKSDQLNMRIAAHMERPIQKTMAPILVDEVVQRRLKNNQRKQQALQMEMENIRQQKRTQGMTPQQLQQEMQQQKQKQKQLATANGAGGVGGGAGGAGGSGGALDALAAMAAAGASSGAGQGVWSSLGHVYQERGGADLELPSLNAGVPLRDLLRSRQPRPQPGKEASEHHKRYENLLELFRNQRHTHVQPPVRDGQNGVPRTQEHANSNSLLGSNSGLLAGVSLTTSSSSAASTAAAAGAAAGTGAAGGNGGAAVPAPASSSGGELIFNPILMDLSTDEGGVNPANQSLLARLYQTHAQRYAKTQPSHPQQSHQHNQHQTTAAQQQAWGSKNDAATSPSSPAAGSGSMSDIDGEGGSGNGPSGGGGAGGGFSSSSLDSSPALSRSASRSLSSAPSGLSSSSSNPTLSRSASSSAHGGGRLAKESMTSVERIAALQPSKNPQQHRGWDAYSIRPLASSASVPNFDRKVASGFGAAAYGLPSRLVGGVNLLALPENHPAHTHPHVSPQAPTLAMQKAMAAEALHREKMGEAFTVGMFGFSGATTAAAMTSPTASSAQTPTASSAAAAAAAAATAAAISPAAATAAASTASVAAASTSATAAAASSTHVKFASSTKFAPASPANAGGSSSAGGGSLSSSSSSSNLHATSRAGGVNLIGLPRPKLDPTHPDYLSRRAESLSLHQARVHRKRQKDAEDKVIFEAVMKQLAESRLDHLHRWRNAFDGTKQKLDRHLIKRLVSRAESRAAALDGGVALQPSSHLNSGSATTVLTAQELSEVAGGGGGGGGSGTNSSGLRSPARSPAGGAADHGFNFEVMNPASPASRARRSVHQSSSRENLLVDDFALADHVASGLGVGAYEGHHRIEEEGEEAAAAAAAAEAEAKAMGRKEKRRTAERMKKEALMRSGSAAASSSSTPSHGEDQTRAYQFVRPKHLSGLQQSNQADIVIEAESKSLQI